MGKSAWIATAVAVLLAVGAGVVVLFAKNKMTPAVNPNQQTGANVPQESVVQGNSLKDFLGLGVNQECSYTDPETQGGGVVHVSNGRVHGEFSSNLTNTEVLSNLIVSGDTFYMWQEGETEGFMMPLSRADEMSGTQAGQTGVDINNEVDYTCVPWAVDESVFAIPEEVTFSDYSAMLENLKSTFPEGAGISPAETANCAVCDSLTGDPKTQCLTSLGCQ